jgi:Zn-dependent M28 family amino/carboxypeptidase
MAVQSELTISEPLRRAVTVEGIRSHLAVFQAIADANGGNRAAGTSGYDLSALYVYNELALAGYQVTLQPFDFPFFAEISPPELAQVSPAAESYQAGEDFMTLGYSPSGDVTAPVEAVDLVLPTPSVTATITSGCEARDFAGFRRGHIALLQRGTCTFTQKAHNAETAGAAAVIVFNDGQPGHTGLVAATLAGPARGGPQVSIPVVVATFALGRDLAERAAQGPVTLHLKVSTEFGTRTTYNVIADSPQGRDGQVLVVGAHLDSATRGPGINDNGSGSAVTLEIARQMAQLPVEPRHKVRFAFWGAEEEGLLGSRHYVSRLSPAELRAILANLNFDMVGSPNFVRFVYDGGRASSAHSGDLTSAAIEQLFAGYFTAQGLESEPTAMGGQSDFASFAARGIPTGGLFTGVDTLKSTDEAAVYGGTAGAPYDPCYHQACDTYANISDTALDQMSDAAAHVILALASW